jgi:predicted ABC-type ATPase
MNGYSIKSSLITRKNKKYKDVVDKIIDLSDNKIIYNNINELIEREYYSKYINNSKKSKKSKKSKISQISVIPLSIYEKEILNNYSNILHNIP